MQDTQTHPDGARLGEVVESTSTGFTTHCYRLDELPPLGGLVRGGRDRPSVRHSVRRLHAQHRPGAPSNSAGRGRGHRGGRVPRKSPARAVARIHSFVRECAGEELQEFSRSMDFAPLLLAAPTTAQDEVLAAFLRLARDAHPDPNGFLVQAGRELVAHFPGQTQRLSGVLRRLAW